MFNNIELAITRQSLKLESALERGEDAQGLVEYALVIALIAVAAVATMTTLGTTIGSKFTSITGSL